MVRRLADYPWSSYRYNANGNPVVPVTPHDCRLLLGEDDAARRAAYRALCSESLDRSGIERIRDSIITGLPTGNGRFRREIEKTLAVRPGQAKRGRPRKPRA
jgi:putative transposase